MDRDLMISDSFDPAIHLHSQLDNDFSDTFAERSCSYSDDIAALNKCRAEDIEEKNRKGIVIQYRAWRLEDSFRSEDDYALKSSPTRTANSLKCTQSKKYDFSNLSPLNNLHIPDMASSPPRITPESAYQDLETTQFNYPKCNSLVNEIQQLQSPCKKRKLNDSSNNIPNGNIPTSRIYGGFFADLSDDDEDVYHPTYAMVREQAKCFSESIDFPLKTPQDVIVSSPIQEFTSLVHDSGIALHSQLPQDKTVSQGEFPSIPLYHDLGVNGDSVLACTTDGRHILLKKVKDTGKSNALQSIIERFRVNDSDTTQRNFYGINMYKIMQNLEEDERKKKELSASQSQASNNFPLCKDVENFSTRISGQQQLWCEKYRAKSFTTLIGDERVQRSVLRWFKSWDSLVFPGSRPKQAQTGKYSYGGLDDHPIRKLLLLSGPPGLGKTTLAHVCANHAGYDVREINASDERSSMTVKTRVRDMLGMESLSLKSLGSSVDESDNNRNAKVVAGRPICLVIDEVDGSVSGEGEGGFISALLDLFKLDQNNHSQKGEGKIKKKKGKDMYRIYRPVILIANDLYAPSLRLLRHSPFVELIRVKPPQLGVIASRMESIFQSEGIAADGDAIRRMCEHILGRDSAKMDKGASNGSIDIRSILVSAEWIARKWRYEMETCGKDCRVERLRKSWIEEYFTRAENMGIWYGNVSGNVRSIVRRVFTENAGMSKLELSKLLDDKSTNRDFGQIKGRGGNRLRRVAMKRIDELVRASGNEDGIVNELFMSYLDQAYQDDLNLTKPCTIHDYLYFHDMVSTRVQMEREYELVSLLTLAAQAFHYYFSSPLSILRQRKFNEIEDKIQSKTLYSSWGEYEAAKKAHIANLKEVKQNLTVPTSLTYGNEERIAMELLPNLRKMLMPGIKATNVGFSVKKGGEEGRGLSISSVCKAADKRMLSLAVNAALASGVKYERIRVTEDFLIAKKEDEEKDEMDKLRVMDSGNVGNAGWAYIMVPGVDELTSFRGINRGGGKLSFLVARAIEEERQRCIMSQRRIREREGEWLKDKGKEKDLMVGKVSDKKNVIKTTLEGDFLKGVNKKTKETDKPRVWVTYSEGYSNAVKKPISLEDFISLLV